MLDHTTLTTGLGGGKRTDGGGGGGTRGSELGFGGEEKGEESKSLEGEMQKRRWEEN